jgi:hypothetical protein
LSRIPGGLIPELQEMSWSGIIYEAAACLLAKEQPAIQVLVAKYIRENDVREVKGQHVPSLINRSAVTIESYVPVEAFTDADGKQWPHIREEEWYVEMTNGMFTSYLTVDEKAMNERSLAFHKMIASSITVLPATELSDYRYSYHWQEVEMGTHPNEVAVWDSEGFHIRFYAKRDDIERLNKPVIHNNYVIAKTTNSSNSKINKQSATLRLTAMREHLASLVKDGLYPAQGHEVLYSVIASFIIQRLNTKAKTFLNTLTDEPIDIYKLDNVDCSQLILSLATAMLYGEEVITADHKALLAENDIIWDNVLKSIEVTMKHEKDAIRSETSEKVKVLEQRRDEVKEMLMWMTNTYVLHTSRSLIDSIEACSLGDNVNKYISKKLGLKHTAGAIGAMRLRSSVKALMAGYELVHEAHPQQVEHRSVIDEAVIKIKHTTVNMRIIDYLSDLYETMNVLLGCETVEYKHRPEAMNEILSLTVNEKWQDELAAIIYRMLHADFNIGYSILYLDNKGKVRILE